MACGDDDLTIVMRRGDDAHSSITVPVRGSRRLVVWWATGTPVYPRADHEALEPLEPFSTRPSDQHQSTGDCSVLGVCVCHTLTLTAPGRTGRACVLTHGDRGNAPTNVTLNVAR